MWNIDYKGYVITIIRENDQSFSYIVRDEPNGNEMDSGSEFFSEDFCIDSAKLSVEYQLNN